MVKRCKFFVISMAALLTLKKLDRKFYEKKILAAALKRFEYGSYFFQQVFNKRAQELFKRMSLDDRMLEKLRFNIVMKSNFAHETRVLKAKNEIYPFLMRQSWPYEFNEKIKFVAKMISYI